MRSLILILVASAALASASPPLRIVAANLTAGNEQSYALDNANHSNPEGAGARILKGLKPDVVLIQEFNTNVPVRQWVNQTLGTDYAIHREDGAGIPNGIISRFPIISAGEWDDPFMDNRDFAWTRIALPGGRKLWAVSVHFSAKKSGTRTRQAEALVAAIRREVPAEDLVVIGGDLNTRQPNEPCLAILARVVAVGPDVPSDAFGNPNTNAPRNRPYDWVLVEGELDSSEIPIALGGQAFKDGLVFDSRVFTPLAAVKPVQPGDSGVPGMQHMAVVRDFAVP